MILLVGHENYVLVNEVDAILSYSSGSAPLRSLVKELKEQQKVLDVTMGRKARSLISLKSGKLVISSLDSYALFNRLTGAKRGKTEG